MRLGQLARKYGVTQQEIISYLKEKDSVYTNLGHNSKLDEQATTWVAKQFEGSEVLGAETTDQIEQSEVKREVTDKENISETLPEDADASLPETQLEEPQEKNEVAIETDKLLELLETEDVDLSKITLIKASKKELEGLKVVGKIELPVPKSKTAEKKQQEKEVKDERTGRHQRRQLSEEELEKRRLKAKKRKEEYEAREERRRKQKEKRQQKALNKARYQQKLQRSKSSQSKLKDKTQTLDTSAEIASTPSEPKTLLGKFWRWMNT